MKRTTVSREDRRRDVKERAYQARRRGGTMAAARTEGERFIGRLVALPGSSGCSNTERPSGGRRSR
jgi:hypothetical protein